MVADNGPLYTYVDIPFPATIVIYNINNVYIIFSDQFDILMDKMCFSLKNKDIFLSNPKLLKVFFWCSLSIGFVSSNHQ